MIPMTDIKPTLDVTDEVEFEEYDSQPVSDTTDRVSEQKPSDSKDRHSDDTLHGV